MMNKLSHYRSTLYPACIVIYSVAFVAYSLAVLYLIIVTGSSFTTYGPNGAPQVPMALGLIAAPIFTVIGLLSFLLFLATRLPLPISLVFSSILGPTSLTFFFILLGSLSLFFGSVALFKLHKPNPGNWPLVSVGTALFSVFVGLGNINWGTCGFGNIGFGQEGWSPCQYGLFPALLGITASLIFLLSALGIFYFSKHPSEMQPQESPFLEKAS